MNDNDTNEPAYPSFQVRRVGEMERIDVLHPGLTKRELFAAMAMQGLSTDRAFDTPQKIAMASVSIADELLKELAK